MKLNQLSAWNNTLKALVALASAAAIIVCLYWYTGPRPPSVVPADDNPHLTADQKDAFFKERVSPILAANASANAKALETLKSDLHSQFELYRNRVPTFTDHITSLGNKTKITWEAAKQMASDDKDKVKRHVTGKFEMHVVSAEKMQSDLERILHSFRADVEANKNRMLVDIEVTVKADPRFSAFGITLPESFGKKVNAEISAASLQAGNDAVVLSGMTFLVSFATEEAVRNLVTAALTRVGESIAGGGGAGTLGGPAGVVIGIAAGITVGVIVDYVMTERMESKLNQECTAFLTKAEKEITTAPDGLVAALENALTEIDRVEGPIIKQQIELLP